LQKNQGFIQLCAVKMIAARVRSNRLRKANQTKRLRLSGPGKDSPQIHRQLPRDRHHRFLP
jgi:hypothetical protein